MLLLVKEKCGQSLEVERMIYLFIPTLAKFPFNNELILRQLNWRYLVMKITKSVSLTF